jgi:hypothetical protein
MLIAPTLVPSGDWIGPDPVSRPPVTKLDPKASVGIIEGDIGSLDNDRVVFDLSKLGEMTTLDTGIIPDEITGYDAIARDVAAKKHGSSAPRSITNDAATYVKIKDLPPGDALDAISKTLGGPGGFVNYLQNSKTVNDPSSPGWAGFCDELFSMILAGSIRQHLEVQGPEGERGLCVGDYWISRADLTNVLGALLNRTMTDDEDVAFLSIDEANGATNQLKGMMKWTSAEGAGCVCSVWYDLAHNNEHEVWNQTFVHSETTPQEEITGPAAAALLEKAGNPPGGKVILIHQTGYYAVETDDGYEGGRNGRTATERSRDWTYYAVVKPADDQGPNKFELVKAFMADDPTIANLDLPTKSSDEKVAYFWKPTLNELKDLIRNAADDNVDRSEAGKQLRFFAAVLDRGVPGQVRGDFEAAWKKLGLAAGRSAPLDQAKALLDKFPGVAVAYAPATWAQNFPGLDYGKFFAAAAAN